jgi:hypothetical protein
MNAKHDGGRSAKRNVASAKVDCRQASAQLTLDWEGRQTQRHVSGCEKRTPSDTRPARSTATIDTIKVGVTGLGDRWEAVSTLGGWDVGARPERKVSELT